MMPEEIRPRLSARSLRAGGEPRCVRSRSVSLLRVRFIWRWKRSETFRSGGTRESVIEAGENEILGQTFMDHYGGCEMDCIEASKWRGLQRLIDVSIARTSSEYGSRKYRFTSALVSRYRIIGRSPPVLDHHLRNRLSGNIRHRKAVLQYASARQCDNPPPDQRRQRGENGFVPSLLLHDAGDGLSPFRDQDLFTGFHLGQKPTQVVLDVLHTGTDHDGYSSFRATFHIMVATFNGEVKQLLTGVRA